MSNTSIGSKKAAESVIKMSSFYPLDGRSVLAMTDGYHHYLDTGICTEENENKYFFIDGATVRLIRLGSSMEMKFTTHLYNVFITVDSGALWYLNIGSEIDDFAGALTVLFNNGTYEQFVSDYSRGKITPRGGRYFLISPPHGGAKLLCGDKAGHFLVAGAKCAYAVSEDEKTVRYSICSNLYLTSGVWHIGYTEHFSTALLPAPPEGYEWYDDRTGCVRLLPEESGRELHVDPKAPSGGNGSKEHPLNDLSEAVERLRACGGRILLYGKVVYPSLPPYSQTILFEGATDDAELVFDQNRRYYLRGDTVFSRLRITVGGAKRDKAMLISDGHALVYGEGVSSVYGILTGTGSLSAGARSLHVTSVRYLENQGLHRTQGHRCMLLIREGSARVTVGGKSFVLSASSPVVLPEKHEFFLHSDISSPRFLAIDYTAREDDGNTPPFSVDSGADAYFGERIAALFEQPSLLTQRETKKEISYAVERILGLGGIKRSTAQKLFDFIRENYAAIPSVNYLAEHFHLNRSYIQRAYKKAFGISLKTDLTRVRCDAAQVLLHKGYSVSETARLVGYESASSFSRAFREETGHSPKQIGFIVNQ